MKEEHNKKHNKKKVKKYIQSNNNKCSCKQKDYKEKKQKGNKKT